MAQTGYTPILIYSSSTVSQAPSAGNLTNSTLGSELAINITDGKLFYKDNANAVQVIAWKTTPTTAGGTGLTSYTAGDLLYYATGTTLTKLAIGASGYWLGSSGTAPQWNAPAALTKTDDTNVTLTLGGSASTALLNAASLTLGWTGQLAVSRGGTGLSSLTADRIPYGAGTSAFASSANFTYNGTLQYISATTSAGTGNVEVLRLRGSSAFFGVRLAFAQDSFNEIGRIQCDRNGANGIMQIGVSDDGGVAADTKIYLDGGASASTGFISFFTNGSDRGRWDKDGNLKVENGNVVIGTSGKGIDFSATPGTGTSELFADYEEGTFTPTAVGSTTAGTGTYSEQTGVYTKIGRAVYVFIAINWSAHTGTGNLRIAGLPFSAAKNDVASMFANGLTYTGTHLQPFCVGTEIWLNQTSSNAADTYIPMDTNCQLAFSVVYYV